MPHTWKRKMLYSHSNNYFQTFEIIALLLPCLVLFPVFIWCPVGLLAGGPVFLGRVGVAFLERHPSTLIWLVILFTIGLRNNVSFSIFLANFVKK
jgi:hypothetical protein